ncbi:MAG: hypothetical protein JWQ14_2975, partial [Adhaeribacter sp.]|nr:hypothetical protein [Adhaeribacter sp.]
VTGNLSLNFRADLNILFCRFVQPTSSVLLRLGYENALRVAQENHVRFWLFDLRRRGPAQTEDEKWILEDFFPRVEQQTKKYLFFAYLVTPTHYTHVREVIGLEKLAHYSAHSEISIFDSEEKAIDWLMLNQTANAQA